jgi:hypothetical protein
MQKRHGDQDRDLCEVGDGGVCAPAGGERRVFGERNGVGKVEEDGAALVVVIYIGNSGGRDGWGAACAAGVPEPHLRAWRLAPVLM